MLIDYGLSERDASRAEHEQDIGSAYSFYRDSCILEDLEGKELIWKVRAKEDSDFRFMEVKQCKEQQARSYPQKSCGC